METKYFTGTCCLDELLSFLDWNIYLKTQQNTKI